VRIEAGDDQARARDPEPVAQVAGDDASGLDHEIGGESGDHVLEREMDGDRDDGEFG
jgi:hypothetical protein